MKSLVLPALLLAVLAPPADANPLRSRLRARSKVQRVEKVKVKEVQVQKVKQVQAVQQVKVQQVKQVVQQKVVKQVVAPVLVAPSYSAYPGVVQPAQAYFRSSYSASCGAMATCPPPAFHAPPPPAPPPALERERLEIDRLRLEVERQRLRQAVPPMPPALP